MAFTYDPTTARGQVRLLAADFDPIQVTHQDADIDALLLLNASNVRLAAAQALDVQAAIAGVTQGGTRFAGIQMNAQIVAEVLSGRAAELRRQVYAGEDGTEQAPFAIVEWVVDPFSYRDKLINEMLRLSGT